MGVSNSKSDTSCEPLRLCKERKKFMKQATDSRYNLAAAHVVYMQSLQNIGIALCKFAETQVSLDLLNMPQIGCNADPGGQAGELGSSQPHSPNNSALSYMKSGSANAVTVNIDSDSNKVYVDDVESLPPPPPPPTTPSFGDLKGFVTPPESVHRDQNGHDFDNVVDSEVNESRLICKNDRIEQCDSKNGCLAVEETEDPSEFITHRAKDFLSCIKDIEDHFIRASKSGDEVSRMLEANKIQVSYTEAKSTGSVFVALNLFSEEDTTLVLLEAILQLLTDCMLEKGNSMMKRVNVLETEYDRKTKSQHGETKNQILAELQHEIEYFGSSFSDLVKCCTLYVESINSWLQNCIILPKERAKSRRAFCPRRAVAPPIFVICRDWSAGIQNLPSQKLSDTIKDLLSNVRLLSDAELKNGQEMKNDDVLGLNLSTIHSSLTKVLDRLTKFAEDSLKMYEDIKHNSETAGNAYSNYRPPPRPFSI
ncbi:nitrate regulatory gene2 protein [Tanacetum coccineum]